MSDGPRIDDDLVLGRRPGRVGRPPTLDRGAALRAARDVIARRGLQRTRYADVAQQAGIPVTSLQQAFGSLGGLLTEALECATSFEIDGLRAATATTGGSAWERVAAFVRCAMGPSGHPDGWLLWLELWALAGRDAEMGARAGAIYEPWWEHVAGLIREGVATGEFRGELVSLPVVAAQAVVGVVDGVACPLVMRADGPDIDRATQVALRAVAAMLGVEHADPDRDGLGDEDLPRRVDAALRALAVTAHVPAEATPIEVDGPEQITRAAGLGSDAGI